MNSIDCCGGKKNWERNRPDWQEKSGNSLSFLPTSNSVIPLLSCDRCLRRVISHYLRFIKPHPSYIRLNPNPYKPSARSFVTSALLSSLSPSLHLYLTNDDTCFRSYPCFMTFVVTLCTSETTLQRTSVVQSVQVIVNSTTSVNNIPSSFSRIDANSCAYPLIEDTRSYTFNYF